MLHFYRLFLYFLNPLYIPVMRWYSSVGHFTFKMCFLAILFKPECLFNINHFLLWKILKNISFILWMNNVKQACRPQLPRERRSINFVITSILLSCWYTRMFYTWGNILEFSIPSYLISETLFFVKDLDWKRTEAIIMSLFFSEDLKQLLILKNTFHLKNTAFSLAHSLST